MVNIVEPWLKDFVLNEYNQAQKTVHVDYDNVVIMSVKLKNGYIVVEHCICTNPREFDLSKGIEICKEKIFNHLLSIYHFRTIENPENIKKWGEVHGCIE